MQFKYKSVHVAHKEELDVLQQGVALEDLQVTHMDEMHARVQ